MKRLWIIALLLLLAVPLMAQEGTVTDDDVNDIASKMYCPVCENIPLDTCGTAACADWRYEIELMLEEGLTEQAIIDDFVFRFGDRVVGVPQDQTLRILSLWVPRLAIVLSLLAVLWFALRNGGAGGHVLDNVAESIPTMDDWRAQVERDVRGAS